MLAALDGDEVPGGCDHCDATQTVGLDASRPGVFTLTIRHDEWCTWWLEHYPMTR
jgi:hypothetical protein